MFVFTNNGCLYLSNFFVFLILLTVLSNYCIASVQVLIVAQFLHFELSLYYVVFIISVTWSETVIL